MPLGIEIVAHAFPLLLLPTPISLPHLLCKTLNRTHRIVDCAAEGGKQVAPRRRMGCAARERCCLSSGRYFDPAAHYLLSVKVLVG
jgi:hypothetical protein